MPSLDPNWDNSEGHSSSKGPCGVQVSLSLVLHASSTSLYLSSSFLPLSLMGIPTNDSIAPGMDLILSTFSEPHSPGVHLCFYYKLLPVRHLNILKCLSDCLGSPNPTLPSSSCPLSLLDSQISLKTYLQSAVLSTIRPSVSSIPSFCHTSNSPKTVLTGAPMLILPLNLVHNS